MIMSGKECIIGTFLSPFPELRASLDEVHLGGSLSGRGLFSRSSKKRKKGVCSFDRFPGKNMYAG